MMFFKRGTSAIFLVGCLIVARLQPLTALAVLNAVMKLKNTFGCENDILRIRCSHESGLEIINVEFGRLLKEVCPVENFTKSCSVMQNHDDPVKKLCNGKQVCSMEVSTDVFGDPCPGVRKYMSVIYACVRNPDWLTTTASSPTERTTLITPKPSTETASMQPRTKRDTSPIPSSNSANSTNDLTTPGTIYAKRNFRGGRKYTSRPTAIVFVSDRLGINAAVTQCEVRFTSLVFALMVKLVLTV